MNAAQPHVCLGGRSHWRSYPCVPGNETYLGGDYGALTELGDLYRSREVQIGPSQPVAWMEVDAIYFLVLEGTHALDADDMIREWMQYIGRERVQWMSQNDPRTASYG